MSDIYRQSFLTIASISSPDSSGGCFSSQKASDLCFRVEGDNFNCLIAARHFEGDGIVADLNAFKEMFPALTRAWIYQERILSRRILYCTHREFQFECLQDNSCECGNRYMPPHPAPKTEASKAALQSKGQYAELEKFHDMKGRFSARQIMQHWQKTVMQYTRLSLTKPSDKLPALSGCAKDIGRITQDQYLAGLWRKTLAEGMLWVVNTPVDRHRPQVYRAPSWSWASVDTNRGIEYIFSPKSRNRDVFQNRIEAAECVSGSVDQTGAVKSGSIRLRASVCPTYLRRICRMCKSARSPVGYTIEYDQWLTTRSHNIVPCPNNGNRGLDLKDVTSCFFPDYKYDSRFDIDSFDVEFPARDDGFACRLARVFLLHLYDSQSFASDIITDYFLVLTRPSQSSGLLSYKRIALFSLSFKDWDKRENWFKTDYKLQSSGETVITIE